MMKSLKTLVEYRRSGDLPLDLFQLDDGWQSAWGDWLLPDRQRFPNGLKSLAAAVRQAGMMPGLWLAPAALVAGSVLASEHPDWLLRDARGKPLTCGFTAPGLWMLALDLTNPMALRHVHEVVRTIVHEWGFGYLKCDFLHCAAMPGAVRHDASVSRALVLERLLETMPAKPPLCWHAVHRCGLASGTWMQCASQRTRPSIGGRAARTCLGRGGSSRRTRRICLRRGTWSAARWPAYLCKALYG